MPGTGRGSGGHVNLRSRRAERGVRHSSRPARTGLDLSVLEAIGASAAMLGNVGPALGFAGPFGSYEPFSDVSTLIMTALMWLGRLEIIPIVVLFTRHYWRNV